MAGGIGATKPSTAKGFRRCVKPLLLIPKIWEGSGLSELEHHRWLWRAATAEGWLGLSHSPSVKWLSLLEGGSDRSPWK